MDLDEETLKTARESPDVLYGDDTTYYHGVDVANKIYSATGRPDRAQQIKKQKNDRLS